MMRLTTALPVNGKVHAGRILESPFLVQCSINTITRCTPPTKSIAPPMPLTILPGIIQLAKSPLPATSIAPKIAKFTAPPRIIANDSELEKKDAPGRAVTVCLPALIKSGSMVASVGNSPMPSKPFSDCNHTSTPSGMWLATMVGKPMPKFT